MLPTLEVCVCVSLCLCVIAHGRSVTDCSVCLGASAEQQQYQPDRRRGSGSAVQPGHARSGWKPPAAPQV